MSNATREIRLPHDGFYAFQSKSDPTRLPLAVILGDGVTIDDYREITEEEYVDIIAKQEEEMRKQMEAMGIHAPIKEV